MSRKRMADIRRAKDARAKKLVVVGAVLFVAVLAFEVPKVMKHGSSTSSTPPAATTTTAAVGPSAPPQTTAPGVLPAAAAAVPAGSTKLPNSDPAPKRSKSQLVSFSQFSGKDPFAQQVVDIAAGLPDPAGQDASGNPVQTSASSGGNKGVTLASSVRTLATNGAVRLQVNGRIENVRIGASFPSENPLFRLVSVARGIVRVGIANGSYASGARTVALTPGKTLTLVDTADGIRYRIRLLVAS